MAEYESVLCVKPQVHVYKIPPRPSNRGYRAADWKLDQPDWTGRLRVVAKGRDIFIKLEDRNSGELFAKCPVEQYPGIAVEAVTDSSRYFVIRIKDDGGRSAFIGIGFEDRGDSFDLNVALQDHFKHLKQEVDAEKSIKELEKGPKLDLGFKEGQTIRINISTKKNPEGEDGTPKKARPKPAGGLGFLPPPPGGVGGIAPPPGSVGGIKASSPASSFFQSSGDSIQQHTNTVHSVQNNTNNVDLLLDLGGPTESTNIGQGQTVTSVGGQSNTQSQNIDLLGGFDSNFDLLSSSTGTQQQDPAQPAQGTDPWGEFTGANTGSAKTDWIAF